MEPREVTQQLEQLLAQAERLEDRLPSCPSGFDARLGDVVHQLRELRDEARRHSPS